MYGVGEGLGDVRIESGTSSKAKNKTSTLTWQSGAYVIEAASTGALELHGSYYGLTFEGRAPAGEANHKFDIDAKEALLSHWSKLLINLNARNNGTAAKAMRDLAFWTNKIPHLEVPSPLPPEVVQLREQWSATSQATRARLAKGELCPPETADLAARFRDSLMGTWYQEAVRLSDLIEQRVSLQASKGSKSTRERKRKALLKNTGKWIHSMKHPDLQELAAAEVDLLQASDLFSK